MLGVYVVAGVIVDVARYLRGEQDQPRGDESPRYYVSSLQDWN